MTVYVEFLQIAKRKPNRKLSKIVTFHRRGKKCGQKIMFSHIGNQGITHQDCKKRKYGFVPIRMAKV